MQFEPSVESAWFQRLSHKFVKLLPIFAYKFNLRRYRQGIRRGSPTCRGGDRKGSR